MVLIPDVREWDPDAVARQIGLGEDSLFEFEEAFFDRGGRIRGPRRERIADELAAFANGDGGALVFSVSDDGQVRDLTREQMNAIESLVAEACEDRINPALDFVTRRLPLPDGGAVLVVGAPRSPLVHQSPKGYLLRKGSSVRVMSAEALRRLFQRRGRSGLAGPDLVLVSGTGPGTLDSGLAARFLSSRVAGPDEVQLQKLKLLRANESGDLQVTVAGILLATKRPDAWVSGARIEAVRYRGARLGDADQLDAARITGPVDRQIRDAVHFVRKNTWVAARKAPGRIETPQFDPRAVFEAIVNAVVHRDYSREGRRIRLFLFDDRMELYSPGGLPNTLEVDQMAHHQATRNETVASLLHLLDVEGIAGAGDRQRFLEERGEGVPTILRRTRELTGFDPAFEVIGGAELLLTIPSARPPSERIEGRVSVTAAGRPLAGAEVLAQFPNHTWQLGESDSRGQVSFSFHSPAPILVFCAAAGFRGRVVDGWQPPAALTVDLELLPGGGSVIFTDGAGRIFPLRGRLNPVLDRLDRMRLYAANIAIDGGKPQPVAFRLGEPLRLTDVHGSRCTVRFVEMRGKSALLDTWLGRRTE